MPLSRVSNGSLSQACCRALSAPGLRQRSQHLQKLCAENGAATRSTGPYSRISAWSRAACFELSVSEKQMRVRNSVLCVKPPGIWRLVVISGTVTLISS